MFNYGMAVAPIEIYHKHNLTIEEAAEFFNLGENRIRNIIHEDPYAGYILKVGNKTLLKRERFGRFLDDQYEI